MSSLPLFFALPWLLLPVLATRWIRRRPLLDAWPPSARPDAPLVSVIVPARNEAHNIEGCLRTLLSSRYPRFEVIVVDDGSADATARVAEAVARNSASVRVVSGAPLPPGWFGKPWACMQGVRMARGELIAFADADIQVHPELLARSVAALQAERAALLSVIPRHVLESFWERMVMPHFLLLFLLRFPDAARVNESPRSRDKVALGGWIIARRDAYEAIGGHEAVRTEVSEDLRLAQRFHQAGYPPLLVHGDEFLSVRMYRSLGEIVEGWSKNLATSSRQTASSAVRWLVPWLLVLWLVGTWIVPPTALLLGATGAWQGASVPWAVLASAGLASLGWVTCRRLRIPVPYATLLPVGAALATLIVLLSIKRGERVQWKGRKYHVGELEEATS